MTRLPRAMLFAFFASTIPLAGCSLFNGGSSSSNQPLIPAPVFPIADVPIPAGFSLIKSVSTSKQIEASKVRFVDHSYSGPDDYLPVVQFYREQMPQRGWKQVDQNEARTETTLHFTMNNEDCYVTVSAHTFNTHIRIRIDPIGQTPAN